MSLGKEYLKKYAETELELTGFDKTDVGKTILQLLDELSDVTKGDASTMKQICGWLPRLIDGIPISPITEEDFKPEYYGNNNENLLVMRCTRYPYVYKSNDGKYWNDRAVGFKFKNAPETDIMFLYKPNGSKREITLPYYPTMLIEELDADNA